MAVRKVVFERIEESSVGNYAGTQDLDRCPLRSDDVSAQGLFRQAGEGGLGGGRGGCLAPSSSVPNCVTSETQTE